MREIRTSLGEYLFYRRGIFYEKGVENVIISEGITTIHRHAFARSDLLSVRIPATVTRIESGAFNNNRLSSVAIPHGQLRNVPGQRVSGGVIERVIGKWLRAGVLEAGDVRYSDNCTPQGGVLSPLLSNRYLHEVPDGWFVTEVQPRLGGKSFMARYADDAVIGCGRKSDRRSADAGRILKVLALRCA
jgi:hypothetical protein